MGKCLFLRKGETHTAPISGILASDLAVGSSVYLMENGSAVEYLVVHQGLPSSMYDDSCNGCWLLRKFVYPDATAWGDGTGRNSYKASIVYTWLNNTFFYILGDIEQQLIKQVKIPFVNGVGGNAIASGNNGLYSKSFLLSAYEVGWSTADYSYIPVDGACLSFFNGTSQTDTRRIGYYRENEPTIWWLRSPNMYNSYQVWAVMTTGIYQGLEYSKNWFLRPALILPSNALFDKNTLILKGVA